MTIRYVGSGGSDAANGLTWATRKLTLNGVEDTPVVAGDTVYVGPGVYRELLTIDVSGSGGSPITYIADVTGEHTDGIGGIVRITGSDNDQTATRANCISATGKSYRTFTGSVLDISSSHIINCTSGCTNWTVQDCTFHQISNRCVSTAGVLSNINIRRCTFSIGYAGEAIYILHTTTVDNANILIENCLFIGYGYCVVNDKIGGVTIKNSFFSGSLQALRLVANPAAGQYMNVYNCILFSCQVGFNAPASSTQLVEDFNLVCAISTPRNNVTTGANSNAYPPLFWPSLLQSSFQLPQQNLFALSPWSQVRHLQGTGTASDDFYGITRPTEETRRSWGAIQFQDAQRSTTQYYSGTSSWKLAEAGIQQIFIPGIASSITVNLYDYRETNYTGTAPQMIIRQPGQSARTTTDSGGNLAWNLLADTFTPVSSPPWFTIELVSNNTAVTGSYGVYFDALSIQ